MKLRLWHIAESYPPDYGGGAAIYVRDICRVMSRAGHTVRVLCTEARDAPEYSVRTDYDGNIRIDRVNLPYFKLRDPDGWQLGLLRWRRHEKRVAALMRDQLKDWNPHVAHYHTSRPLGEECLVVIKRSGIPILSLLHEGYLICPRLMLLRSPQAKACSGPAPWRCLACLYTQYDSPQSFAWMKMPWRLMKLRFYPAYRLWRRSLARRSVSGALGYSKFMTLMHSPHINGPVEHLPLGIDLAHLVPSTASRPRSPLRFGFFGGFQRTKGIDQLFNAARTLKSRGFRFELHIWGPGENGDWTHSSGLEDILSFRGMYSPDDMWAAFDQVDVAIMATTVCEPFGRIPVEAAAAGVPAIAPAIGGLSETIRHGIDGLLYRFRDAGDLATQMRKILENPELVREFIDNLHTPSDISTNLAQLERFYLEALRRSKRSPVLGASQSAVQLQTLER